MDLRDCHNWTMVLWIESAMFALHRPMLTTLYIHCELLHVNCNLRAQFFMHFNFIIHLCNIYTTIFRVKRLNNRTRRHSNITSRSLIIARLSESNKPADLFSNIFLSWYKNLWKNLCSHIIILQVYLKKISRNISLQSFIMCHFCGSSNIWRCVQALKYEISRICVYYFICVSYCLHSGIYYFINHKKIKRKECIHLTRQR